MYMVMVRFQNGEVEVVAKGITGEQATRKAKEAAGYYVDYGGTVVVTGGLRHETNSPYCTNQEHEVCAIWRK